MTVLIVNISIHRLMMHPLSIHVQMIMMASLTIRSRSVATGDTYAYKLAGYIIGSRVTEWGSVMPDSHGKRGGIDRCGRGCLLECFADRFTS